MPMLTLGAEYEAEDWVRRNLERVLTQARDAQRVTPRALSMACDGRVTIAQVYAFLAAGIGSPKTLYLLEQAAERLGLDWPPPQDAVPQEVKEGLEAGALRLTA